jgi:Fur family iron response transcriptional regulator
VRLFALAENSENGLCIASMTMRSARNLTVDDEFKAAGKWLSGGGLRATRQRLALARLLVGDGMNRHVTAESLFEAAARSGHSVSLATVYNTLRSFTEAGLMAEITVDGTRSYFDTDVSDHAHFYWEDESRLTDAPHGSVHFDRLPEAPEGAEISKVDVVIRLRRA